MTEHDQLKLPKQVRVGFRTYRIEPFGAAGPLTELSANGVHCFESALIQIVGTLDREQAAHIVTVLARILTQVWQDNPDVMDWIGKHAGAR